MYLLKLFYTVRYSRLSQLTARVRLTLKRKLLEYFPVFFNRRFYRKKVHFQVAGTPVKPIFEPRTASFREISDDRKTFSLTFLNEDQTFRLPIDWHREELEKGTRLWKLNLHYTEFLERTDSRWFRKIVMDWIEQNSPYKKGYWLDSWNSFALSIRVVVWMQQVAVRKNELDTDCIRKVAESIYRQLLFLEKNLEKDLTGNHLIKNIKALLWGASFFKDDKQTSRWQGSAQALLSNALDEQVLEDGMHYERSPAYHCQVLADLLECYVVLRESELKQRLGSDLLKMGEALMKVTHPDQKISLFNDGGLDMSYSPRELIDALQTHLNFIPREPGSIVLEKAGYFGLQKNGSFLLFDAGKIGPDHIPAHGHGDIFSFEWTIDDQRIFVDKGVFEYSRGEKRDHSRSTKSHNTVSIGDTDQCEFWGSFRVARRADVHILEYNVENGVFSIEAAHDGYKRLRNSPIHRRSLEFDGSALQIVDTVEGGKGLKAQARFLLAPGIDIQQEGDHYILTTDSLKLLFKSEERADIVPSSWYPNFGVEEKCSQIIVYLNRAPCKATYTVRLI